MGTHSLAETARALVAPGKGILAADESPPTIEKRFQKISLESTEDNRRAYREMLFTTQGIGEHISGVILYDETIRQQGSDGTSFPKVLEQAGIIPGIKVDKGAKPLAGSPDEKVTEGLDGLRDRLAEYRDLGARFTKWRAVIEIGDAIPTPYCLHANAHALGRYAALSQEAGLVPIVEPEVLMDGGHTIGRCYEVTRATLVAVFQEIHLQGVELEGMLLKPNMIVSGKECLGAGRRRGGRRPHRALSPRDGPGRGAGDHVPVRRPERRGRNRPPERHERQGRAAVAAQLLVRPRAARAGARDVARRGGEPAAGAGDLRPPRAYERRRTQRQLFGRARARARDRLAVLAP